MKKTLPCLALALFALTAGPASASAESTDAEVHYLIDFVAASGCTFHRNGSDYDAGKAAEHLALKYRNGAKYVHNTGQFIDRLASASSWTGKAYSVTCAGHTEPSGTWLHRELDRHRDALAGS